MKAAEKGDDKAMFNLGKLYQDGKGVQKDLKKAIECFMKAAEKGNGEAWGNLGSGYYYGHGVENDLKKAAECYENALKKGYTFYTFRLGEMYRDGEGVQKNFEKAIDYFTKAVSNDFAHAGEAGNVLGEMYRDGKGVEKDPKIAEEWFRKAKKKGNSDAIKNLDEMFLKAKNIDEKNEINVITENNYIHEKIDINFIIEKQKTDREEKEKTYLLTIQGNDVEAINKLAKIYSNERNFEKSTELYKRATEILLSSQNK